MAWASCCGWLRLFLRAGGWLTATRARLTLRRRAQWSALSWRRAAALQQLEKLQEASRTTSAR